MSCCGGGGSGGGGGGFIGIFDLGYLEKSTGNETPWSPAAGGAATNMNMNMSYEGPDQKSFEADHQNENCKHCKSSNCSCKFGN